MQNVDCYIQAACMGNTFIIETFTDIPVAFINYARFRCVASNPHTQNKS